jgi:hypothetical protein
VSEVSVEIVPGREAPQFDEREFQDFVELLRSDLPRLEIDPTYVEAIRRVSGGVPARRYFGPYGVDEFLHWGKSGHGRAVDSLSVNAVWSAIEDRLAPGLVPIACDGGGNYFCLDHRQSPPTVVYWLAELSEEEAPATEHVADSFEEFARGLSSQPLVA